MYTYEFTKLSDGYARYWMTMDGWTAEDAALLLHDMNPSLAGSFETLTARGPGFGLPTDFTERTNQIQVEFKAKNARFLNPHTILGWALENGMEVPELLIKWDKWLTHQPPIADTSGARSGMACPGPHQ